MTDRESTHGQLVTALESRRAVAGAWLAMRFTGRCRSAVAGVDVDRWTQFVDVATCGTLQCFVGSCEVHSILSFVLEPGGGSLHGKR